MRNFWLFLGLLIVAASIVFHAMERKETGRYMPYPNLGFIIDTCNGDMYKYNEHIKSTRIVNLIENSIRLNDNNMEWLLSLNPDEVKDMYDKGEINELEVNFWCDEKEKLKD